MWIILRHIVHTLLLQEDIQINYLQKYKISSKCLGEKTNPCSNKQDIQKDPFLHPYLHFIITIHTKEHDQPPHLGK